MWMSKLQLAKLLSDDSEVVSVDIEQSWQFDKVLGTLETTVRTNFCFALETAKFGLVSIYTDDKGSAPNTLEQYMCTPGPCLSNWQALLSSCREFSH